MENDKIRIKIEITMQCNAVKKNNNNNNTSQRDWNEVSAQVIIHLKH